MRKILFTVIFAISLGSLVFAQDSKIPLGEASFTKEQLADYYKVYKNTDVRYLRKVFNKFIAKPLTKNDEEIDLLKKFDKKYFKSKFIVLSRDPDLFGNNNILMIFLDKPDKIFLASVYKNDLRLVIFEEDKSFNKEDLRRVKIRYRKFFEDKKHSI